ncbi:UNVERIFIED_CONTAM: hypothetical protein Sradi_6801600 [Sesamum radiatum]|uniref:Uncharacterized protein n=1 Tax=Sesamum radiatum TaxID=300843 RepID=A0AAW2JSR9_SESRA
MTEPLNQAGGPTWHWRVLAGYPPASLMICFLFIRTTTFRGREDLRNPSTYDPELLRRLDAQESDSPRSDLRVVAVAGTIIKKRRRREGVHHEPILGIG